MTTLNRLCTLYTAIDTDQLVIEIDMLLSVIKATKHNIKIQECHVFGQLSCKWCSDLFYSTRFLNYEADHFKKSQFNKFLKC